MCFYIHKNHPIQKIAENDIVCYKTLERHKDSFKKGVFLSIHRWFQYDFNKKTTYKSHTGKLTPRSGTIEAGMHSFSKYPQDVWENKDVFKCIIPKGTPYYYNPEDKEYVSLEIKFIERITFNLTRVV